MLDTSINLIQVPCRAFLGDLKASNQRKIRLTSLLLSCVKDKQVLPEESCERKEEDDRWAVVTCFRDMLGTMKGLKKPMLSLIVVTSMNWLAWSMFFMYISDWMGREEYRGKPGIKVHKVRHTGYQYGNCGLMLTWLVMGAMSLAVGPIARALGSTKNLLAAGNFILAGGLAMMVYISKLAKDERLERHVDLCFYDRYPSNALRIGVLSFFGILLVGNAKNAEEAQNLSTYGVGGLLPYTFLPIQSEMYMKIIDHANQFIDVIVMSDNIGFFNPFIVPNILEKYVTTVNLSSFCLRSLESSGNTCLSLTQERATPVKDTRRSIDKNKLPFTFAQIGSHAFVILNGNIVGEANHQKSSDKKTAPAWIKGRYRLSLQVHRLL
ncbi:hypothetical protein HN51_066901 [Arachis hypogaea]